MGIVAATGCNTVFGSTYPFNPYLVPWTNSLFENAPADRHGHPRPLGPGRSPGAAAVGLRRRRRDVRHRLPVAVADGRVGRRHQGPRPRHAGLLEHRRPGLDGLVRRPGHQAVRLRQGAPRPAGAAQGARPDPDGPRRGVRRPDDAGPHQPLLPGDHGGQRVPGPGRRSSPTRPASPSTASPTTPPTRQAKLAVDSRAFPLFTYDPRRGASIAERLSLPGQPGGQGGLGEGRPTARRSTSSPSPGPRAASPRTSRRTARRRPEILATQDDRLANWRTLQELAGVRG